MISIYLVSFSGENQPGITTAVTQKLAEYQANILDMGQAVIHDSLSLGILAGIDDSVSSEQMETGLKQALQEFDLRVRITPISHESYAQWVGHQGQPKHVISLLAREITSENIAAVTAVLARYGLDIYHITRLTGRKPLDRLEEKSQACMEFLARGTVADLGLFRRQLLELGSSLDVDLALQEDNVFRRNRRLVAFDMDSTLIQEEVIDELAKRAGVGERVSAITESAMRGELDFRASLLQRVSLLKGLPESVLEDVAVKLRFNPGAEKLLRTLKLLGMKTAILSGGFTYFGHHLQNKLAVDYVFANQLEILNGELTGRLLGDIVDGERKASLLREIAQREGLSLEQVIAVGDGANDLPMLALAGLGIAFHAKPIVRATARNSLSTLGLDAILYLMGFSERDAAMLPIQNR